MLAAANERISFSAIALAQMDLLSTAEKREVMSQLDSAELGHSASATRGNRKINVGRFTVVYRILDGDLQVTTLFARE